jgi:hypothetical protein
MLATVLAQASPLDTPVFDGTVIWELVTLAVVLLIGWMAIKAAIHGAKKGEPAHLGRYAACAVLAIFMLYLAGHAVAISNSDSFNEVGCMAKLTCSKTAPPTTR